MKKLFLISIVVVAESLVFAASYKNNTYQKLADEYTQEAQRAFDAGEYEQSQDYSKKAVENAKLSQAFIEKMIAKSEADKQMRLAQNRLTWAKGIHADRDYPMAYSAGETAYSNAEKSYDKEDYAGATDYAKSVLAALSDVHEIIPLPEFYIVRPWAQTKDCYWNISGRPYVYNNPLLWENLYQANKDSMPNPGDPNLILPGMKMKIPSLSGEYREGTYNPSKKYEPYDSTKK
ncbi:MAG: hypothetical protein LKF96_00950 [Treponema sp.]|jgi:nucleoid-associated protein YgaU|nr:hypothetical protein [Treponema sp.]